MISQSKRFLSAKDVADILEVSQSKAYKIIKELNIELEAKDKITIAGKVSQKYFEKKLYI